VARLRHGLACAALLCGLAWGQQGKPQEPPEEDESLIPKEYSFNPLQAEKELGVGKQYFKKGSYKAAARRFEEATKWNPGLAEAYLRLGEAREKLKDRQAAQQAYAKFLELAPADKRTAAVRKKLGRKT
jgi:tetratricopeptide (TPR) repeat protein